MATESSLHIDPNAFQNLVDDDKYLEDEEKQTQCKIQKAIDEELSEFEISDDEFEDDDEISEPGCNSLDQFHSQIHYNSERQTADTPPTSSFGIQINSDNETANCRHDAPLYSRRHHEISPHESIRPEILDEAAAKLRPINRLTNTGGLHSSSEHFSSQPYFSPNGFIEVENSMTWDLSCPGDMLQPSNCDPAMSSYPPNQSPPLPLVLDSNNANSCQLAGWSFGYHHQVTKTLITDQQLSDQAEIFDSINIHERINHSHDAQTRNFPLFERHFPIHPQFYSPAPYRNEVEFSPSPCDNNAPPPMVWPSTDKDAICSKQRSLSSQSRDSQLSKSVEVSKKDAEVDAVPLNQREIDKLEMLYEARRRTIERLEKELATTKDDLTRELRITKHKLTLMETEKAGLAESVKETQRQLTESKSTIEELKEEIVKRDGRILELNKDYDQIVQKLTITAESAEALNEQLVEMTKNETLQRAKDHQITLVNSLREKYSQELFEVQESLDHAKLEMKSKDRRISELEQDLKEALSNQQLNRWEQSDLINKLTKSLDDSQKKCHELLESAGNEELSRLRQEVIDAQTSKDITDEVNSALREELAAVKEQLEMYETAVHLGVGQNGACSGPDYNPLNDTLIQCGLAPPKKNNEMDLTNMSSMSLPVVTGTKSPHHEISNLRKELEQCLNSYRSKRQENSQLREECFEMKRQLQQTKRLLDQSDRTVRDKHDRMLSLESKLKEFESSHPTAKEITLTKKVEALETEKEYLMSDLESVRVQLNQVTESESKLSLLNQELSDKMNQIFQDLDQERKVSLDRLQEACSAHYEAALAKARESLMKQADEKVAAVKVELKQCLKELDEAKELYVNVCEEKNELEKGLREEFDQQLEKLKTKIREDLEIENEKTMKEAMADVEIAHSKEMLDLRLSLIKEREEETKREIEVQVALAKADWLKDKENAQIQAVDAALKEKDREYSEIIENLTTQIEEANQTNQRLSPHLSNEETQTDQNENDALENLKLENERLQSEVHSLKVHEHNKEAECLRENHNQRLKISELEEEVLSMKQSFDLQEEMRKDYEDRLASLQKELDDAKISLQHAQNKERDSYRQLKTIQNENSELSTECQICKDDINKLNEIISEMKSKQYDRDTTPLNTPEILLTTGRQEENESIKTLQEDLDQLNMRYQHVLIERDNLRMEIREMEKELKNMESTLNGRFNDHCSKIEAKFKHQLISQSKEKRAEWQVAAWRYVERECGHVAEQLARYVGLHCDYRAEGVTRVRSSGDTRTLTTPEFCGGDSICGSTGSFSSPIQNFGTKQQTADLSSPRSNCSNNTQTLQDPNEGKRNLKQFSSWLVILLNSVAEKFQLYEKQINEIRRLLTDKDETHQKEIKTMEANNKKLVDGLRQKMEELRDSYSSTVTSMHKQMEDDKMVLDNLSEERRSLFAQVEDLNNRLKSGKGVSQRGTCSIVSQSSVGKYSLCDTSAVQTDLTCHELEQYLLQRPRTSSCMSEEETKARYEDTVKKIRDEVLAYLSSSQSRTSAALRREVLRAERRSCCQFASTMRYILTNCDNNQDAAPSSPTHSVESFSSAVNPSVGQSSGRKSSLSFASALQQQSGDTSKSGRCETPRKRFNATVSRDWLLGVLDTIILNSSSPYEEVSHNFESFQHHNLPRSASSDKKNLSDSFKAEWLPCNDSIVFESSVVPISDSNPNDNIHCLNSKPSSNRLSNAHEDPLSRSAASFTSESDVSFGVRDDPTEILKRIKVLYDNTFENCLASSLHTSTNNQPDSSSFGNNIEPELHSSLYSKPQQTISNKKRDRQFIHNSDVRVTPLSQNKRSATISRESVSMVRKPTSHKLSSQQSNDCNNSMCLVESSIDYSLMNDVKSRPEDPVLNHS